jgi:hypothetical protein
MLHGLPYETASFKLFRAAAWLVTWCPFLVGVLRAIRLPPGLVIPAGCVRAVADLEDLHVMIMGWFVTQVTAEAKTETEPGVEFADSLLLPTSLHSARR